MRNFVIVPDASVWEHMEGETPIIKRLNSYLTVRYIMRKDIPSDECLSEAREVAALWTKDPENFKEACSKYLLHFATSYPYDPVKKDIDRTKPEINERRAKYVPEAALEILRIIEECSK